MYHLSFIYLFTLCFNPAVYCILSFYFNWEYCGFDYGLFLHLRWHKEGFVSRWRLGSFLLEAFEDLDLEISLCFELVDREFSLFLDILERFFSIGDFDLDRDDLEYSERLKLSYLLIYCFFIWSRRNCFFYIFYWLLRLRLLILRLRLLLLLLLMLLLDFYLWGCLLFSFSLFNFDFVFVVDWVLFIKVDC